LLAAADLARDRGVARATVIELGVGAGTGLLNLCDLGARVSAATGVAFDIVGFDTGRGMPAPADFRDHPELYQAGWFPMDVAAVTAALPPHARLILGDLKETTSSFVQSLRPESPIGFVSLDVDFYSSSKAALEILKGPPACYFPWVPLYVDDVA